MDNRLIKSIFEELSENFTVMRFNFSYVDQAVEKDKERNKLEIEACMQYLGCAEYILIGKSYGAKLSAEVAFENKKVIKEINLGYPFHKDEELSSKTNEVINLNRNADRIFFIIGSEDPLFNFDAFKKLVPSGKLIKIENAGHSFNGKDEEATLCNEMEAIRHVKEIVLGKI